MACRKSYKRDAVELRRVTVSEGNPLPLFNIAGDGLLLEILIRLFPDSKSATRCKLVCKRWRMLIGSPIFNLRFASRHQFLLAQGVLSIPSSSQADDLSTLERWAELISWQPRAMVYENFLSKCECDYLISQAKPHMVRSQVLDSTTLLSKVSSTRTSTGTTLARGRDKIVSDIEKRIADFTFIPLEHGTSLSILHYEIGQKFEPHFDYFTDKKYVATLRGGQRIATLVMYLTDVEEGGVTYFPSAKPNCKASSAATFVAGEKGLSVKPKMGDAVLFWSMKADGSLDPASRHGGSAVTKGDKWCAIKFLHLKKS